MTIIEKYDPYFAYLGILINVFIAIRFLSVWLDPDWNQAVYIETMAILMGFEFVMVHSGVFMAAFSKKISLYIFFPLYGLFALCFALMIDDWKIIAFTYLFAVLNRMRFAFADVPQHIKSRNLVTSIFAVIVYFILIFIVGFGADMIPEFGLTQEYLQHSGYIDNIETGGILIDLPQTAMCLGVGYYTSLALMEFYLVNNTNRFYNKVA